MAKCKAKIAGKHDCPNEEWRYGHCMLHADVKLEEKDTLENMKVFKQDFLSILGMDVDEVSFEDVKFPSKFRYSGDIEKEVRFVNCIFASELKISDVRVLVAPSFEHCRFQGVSISKIRSRSDFLYSNCVIAGMFEIRDQEEDDIGVLNEDSKANVLQIVDVKHFRRLQIISVNERSEFNNIKAIRTNFDGNGQFDLDTNIKYNIHFTRVLFGSPFKIMVPDVGKSNPKLRLDMCALNNLFIWNYNEYNESSLIIEMPYVVGGFRKIIRRFKHIRKSQDLDRFVRFCRFMKKRFSSTEHRDVYDLYFILDTYYSRYTSSYGKLNGIINRFSYCFSMYGYSLPRSMLWLVVILVMFNFAYFFFDSIGKNLCFSQSISQYFETFGDHLARISFFRTPRGWLAENSWKRTIFIFEGLLLIPIITAIILSIRKIFKRT
jgi:hypothetical protein